LKVHSRLRLSPHCQPRDRQTGNVDPPFFL
jgi:hypothetical protein